MSAHDEPEAVVSVRHHAPKGDRLNAVFAVFSAVLIYFLSQVIALNLLAIYLTTQGASVGAIIEWLRTGVIGPFVSQLAVAIVGIFLVHGVIKLLKTRWSTIGLKKPKPVDLIYAFVGYGWYFVIYLVAAYFISKFLNIIDVTQAQQLAFSTDTSGIALVLVFLGLVVLPPLYEEVLTRGLLFTGLRKNLPLPVAAIITSLLFGAAHLGWSSGEPLLWIAGIDTFILSMVLVYLREKTDSLWSAIGLHAIKNLVAFTVLFII